MKINCTVMMFERVGQNNCISTDSKFKELPRMYKKHKTYFIRKVECCKINFHHRSSM